MGIIEDFFEGKYNKGIAGIAAGGMLKSAYDELGRVGKTGREAMDALAQTQLEQTQFLPYTVRTAMGGGMRMMVDPSTGNLQVGTSLSRPEEQLAMSNLQGAQSLFERAFQDPTSRTEDIYKRTMEFMRPQMQDQQLALEERLAAQGRLGTVSNRYGGTPEQYQMNRAQQDAMNQAYFSAMNQAMQEQQQQSNLAGQFLTSAYMPQQQMLAALQPGMTAAAQQQQARQFGAGLFGEATASGINALLAANQARANMLGAASTGLIGGMFGGD